MKQLLRWGILISAVTAAIVNQARELGYTGPILSPVIPGDANVVNAMLTPQSAYNSWHQGRLCQATR